MHAFSYTRYYYILAQKRVQGNKFAPCAYKGYLVGIVSLHIYQMQILEIDKIITIASVKFTKYSSRSYCNNFAFPTLTLIPLLVIYKINCKPLLLPLAADSNSNSNNANNFQLLQVGRGNNFNSLDYNLIAPTHSNNKALP